MVVPSRSHGIGSLFQRGMKMTLMPSYCGCSALMVLAMRISDTLTSGAVSNSLTPILPVRVGDVYLVQFADPAIVRPARVEPATPVGGVGDVGGGRHPVAAHAAGPLLMRAGIEHCSRNHVHGRRIQAASVGPDRDQPADQFVIGGIAHARSSIRSRTARPRPRFSSSS